MNNPFQPKQENKKPTLAPLRLLKTTVGVGKSLAYGNPEKAVSQLVVAGLKMAGDSPFYDPAASPLKLSEALKTTGIATLAWAPETLWSEIDQRFGGMTPKEAGDALEHFHKTGYLKTKVPQLVREKIYAIRVVATSNSAQTEWHVFEKVGGAFNDRTAQFGTVEPLSAAECAKTVAIIENIRPDTYENEIKAYIGAACHMDGLYTVEPVKWLAQAESFLQQMNYESTGEQVNLDTKASITAQYYILRKASLPREVPDDMIEVQAAKLAAIDAYAEESTLGTDNTSR